MIPLGRDLPVAHAAPLPRVQRPVVLVDAKDAVRQIGAAQLVVRGDKGLWLGGVASAALRWVLRGWTSSGHVASLQAGWASCSAVRHNRRYGCGIGSNRGWWRWGGWRRCGRMGRRVVDFPKRFGTTAVPREAGSPSAGFRAREGASRHQTNRVHGTDRSLAKACGADQAARRGRAVHVQRDRQSCESRQSGGSGLSTWPPGSATPQLTPLRVDRRFTCCAEVPGDRRRGPGHRAALTSRAVLRESAQGLHGCRAAGARRFRDPGGYRRRPMRGSKPASTDGALPCRRPVMAM